MITDNPNGRPDIGIYTALLTQTGSGDPTAIVLNNTTGMTVTWTRQLGGNYQAGLSETIDPEKLDLRITPTYYDINYGIKYYNTTTIILVTAVGGTGTDGCLLNTPVEIRIYNENF